MVIGPKKTDAPGLVIQAHQIIDLSAQTDRESLWNLEVMETWAHI
jgi:hypothetical protein